MRLVIAAMVASLCALPHADAEACGVFFDQAAPVTMDAQQVLMVFREDTVALHVQVVAKDASKATAWVLPVPVAPEISLGSNAIFSALRGYTEPAIISHQDPGFVVSGGCGGSADAAGNFRAGGDTSPVTQIASGKVGSYTYDVVQATSAEELVDWLKDEGYAVEDTAADALAPYVAQGLAFVWARLSDDVTVDESTALAPLVITFPRPINSQYLFPLGLSRLSSAEVMPVLFFVLADKRFRVTNYGSTDLQGLADRFANADGLSYDATFDLLTEESGGRLMLTEFAQDLTDREDMPVELAALVDTEAHYLTRIYARPKPAYLIDANLTFADDAPDVAPTATPRSTDSHAGLPFMLLLGSALWMLRRRERASAARD